MSSKAMGGLASLESGSWQNSSISSGTRTNSSPKYGLCLKMSSVNSATRESELSSASNLESGINLSRKCSNAPSPPQLHTRYNLRQRRCAFIQKADQVTGGWLHNFRPFDLRRGRGRQAVINRPLSMDDTLINFLNRFQMGVQFLQQFLARGRAAQLRGRHLFRQQIQVARRGRQGMGLAVFGELQPVLQVSEEAIRGNQASEFGGRKQILLA